MPVYQLIDEIIFPPQSHAEPNGLLAIGGDLSVERLLLAYSSGIFPWFNADDPILWWTPDPRFVIVPSEISVSRSLEKVLKKGKFAVTVNKAFNDVIKSCAQVRTEGGEGTWITKEMIRAYCKLHEMGFAHSIESWYEGKLAGGLYGLCLGKCFFGESMFHTVTDASKAAFVSMVRALEKRKFHLIDCQMPTEHLKSFGARGIRRNEFLDRLIKGGVFPSGEQCPVDFGIFNDH
ncbi:MAG: leucyl/phenylalanyl-tRNA--protein transferase [Deltaproteobacteria bacterium]|nr:leucyl/phenylalanyl-tRNA--protein transferase [Deltaproteobacteria bacterium]